MNPRIFVGAAIAAILIVIAVIATSGTSLVNEISQRGLSPQEETPAEIKPIQIELDGIKTLEITKNGAILEIQFTASNPNTRSVLLQMIKYQLFEDGVKITGGQIGDRPEGMVDVSNYYTLLGDASITLKDKIELKNSGNAPEFWSALETNTPKWKVSGEAFFNLSSMTSGQENEVQFEFIP